MKFPWEVELPEGKEYGFIFSISTGRQLDVYGKIHNTPRKRWLIFKEPDFIYKHRIVKKALVKEGT